MCSEKEGMGEQRKGIPTNRLILTRQAGSQILIELTASQTIPKIAPMGLDSSAIFPRDEKSHEVCHTQVQFPPELYSILN